MKRAKKNADGTINLQKKFLFWWFTSKKYSAREVKHLHHVNYFNRKNIELV